MPFYQNPFDAEFRGTLVTGGERQMSLTFPVSANKNHSDMMESWNFEPYDFSTYNTFTFNFAYDTNFMNYSTLSINVAGATPGATTAAEVAAALNANASFSSLFVAEIKNKTGGRILPAGLSYSTSTLSPNGPYKVTIRSLRTKSSIRAYITNAGAEQKLRFNRYASVAELPTYMDRHRISSRFDFTDSLGMLIKLDQTDAVVDQPIITDAGLDYSAMKADWQLLHGRTVTFLFKKITVDGSNRITQIIEYPAGAVVGDLARKIKNVYTAANTYPDKTTEEPYVLTSGDLVTP